MILGVCKKAMYDLRQKLGILIVPEETIEGV